MKKIVAKIYILIISCLVLISCTKTNTSLPETTIKMGTAKISGKIEKYNSSDNLMLRVAISNPITVETTITEVKLNDNGSFDIEIPVEYNPVFASLLLQSDSRLEGAAICFESDEKIRINYNVDKEGNYIPEAIEGTIYFMEDTQSWGDLMMKMSQDPAKEIYTNMDSVSRYIADPKDYTSFVMNYDWGKRLEIAQKDTIISERGENYIVNEVKLHILRGSLINYVDAVKFLFEVNRAEGDTTSCIVNQPEKSYYSFLKDFDLNNPRYLNGDAYASVIDAILNNEALGVPQIGEMPIAEWLKATKEILADLVGFNEGLFYDILIGNAYSRQFNNELKPLSDKQKQNIQDYYGNKEIAKILLRKSEEISRMSASKGELIVNETPDVLKEKLLETIISKYKGKVVFVDYWATWCGPCLESMREIRPLKIELNRQDVVFVYITNESSPKKLWEEKIKGIGGEHYYLEYDEWEFILDKYDFSGIPTYMFFDKNGELKEQITAYPGNDKVKEIIQELQ